MYRQPVLPYLFLLQAIIFICDIGHRDFLKCKIGNHAGKRNPHHHFPNYSQAICKRLPHLRFQRFRKSRDLRNCRERNFNACWKCAAEVDRESFLELILKNGACNGDSPSLYILIRNVNNRNSIRFAYHSERSNKIEKSKS